MLYCVQKEGISVGMMMGFTYDSRPIQTLINQIKNVDRRDGMDLRPHYQRGYIWSDEFKDKLLYSIIRGYPIGNISLRVRVQPNEKGAMQEVVDGQQRLTTISNFIAGEYTVRGEYSRKMIEYILDYMGDDRDDLLDRLKKRLCNKGKVDLKYTQLPELIRQNLNAYNVSITNITNATDREVTEYFRFLQNQEFLRAGEIINSIPDTKLDQYLKGIEDKQKFLKVLRFPDDRREFDRIFYSVMGLMDRQIGFGITDKVVLDYVTTHDELSPEAQEKVSLLVNQINFVTQTLPPNFISTNRRCLKFFMILAAAGLVDFTVDTALRVKSLETINRGLSAFSSAKADSIARTYTGYSTEVIEELRLIALISKGGQSYRRVLNRMEILAYYINNPANHTIPSQIIPA